MKFPVPLTSGRLIKRYKRFLADIELESGDAITAHCANPGSMLGLATPGARVWVSPVTSPAAKLKYKWELVEADGALVGINTAHPNTIAQKAIRAGQIAELQGYASFRREVKYGTNSRIDLLLENGTDTTTGGQPCYVEVKSVTLRRNSAAEFPDSVTTRGTKHLEELKAMVRNGARAVMFYIIQRGDCSHFSVADDIDPAYGKALRDAMASGVEAICYDCHVSPTAIVVRKALSIKL